MAVNFGWHGHIMSQLKTNEFEQGQELLIRHIKQACEHIIDTSSKDDMPLDLFNLLMTLRPFKRDEYDQM